MLPLVPGEAVAGVAADAVDALAVVAGRRRALVDVDLAAGARRAHHAHALEPGHAHDRHIRHETQRDTTLIRATHSPVGGLQREGLVEDGRQQHLRLRAHLQARGAGRHVQRRVGALQAHAAVLARLALALVDVHLAVLAGVGGVAVAVVVVDVVEAGAPVAAGLRRALVDVDGAVVPGVPGAGALARVAVEPVHAAAAVLARARLRATDTRQYFIQWLHSQI